jgi:hypothetical protein
MWFDPQHPDVVFGDVRHETITVTDRSHGKAEGLRVLRIEPDVRMDFRALPYPDDTFRLVAFDPPPMLFAPARKAGWPRGTGNSAQTGAMICKAGLLNVSACSSQRAC